MTPSKVASNPGHQGVQAGRTGCYFRALPRLADDALLASDNTSWCIPTARFFFLAKMVLMDLAPRIAFSTAAGGATFEEATPRALPAGQDVYAYQHLSQVSAPASRTASFPTSQSLQPHGFHPGAQRQPVSRIKQGVVCDADDWIADEVPIALEFNGISHAVMLATPLDLSDFALGFALSEGIIGTPGELYAVDEVPSELGITLKLRIAGAAFQNLKLRRRSLAGRTGCGLCGTESLSHVVREMPALPFLPDAPTISRPAVSRAMSNMHAHQLLHQATGAVHAAAWCAPDGRVMCLREDVGRHNALDKLIGALAVRRVDAAAGFIAVTSRASFEMVQKTASAGVPLLAAVSAPTLLAINTAKRLGMTLVGFARQQDMVVFSHGGRLDSADAPRRESCSSR